MIISLILEEEKKDGPFIKFLQEALSLNYDE